MLCDAAAAQLDVDAVAIRVASVHQAGECLLCVPVGVRFYGQDRGAGAVGAISGWRRFRTDDAAAALEQQV